MSQTLVTIEIPMLPESVSGALSNQLVGGGLVLMLTGALMALLRQVPARLMGLLRRQFIVSVDVQGKDTAFDWLSRWLDKQPYSKVARSLSITTTHEGEEPKTLFTPAPGLHYFWYKGRFVWMTRSRETVQNSSSQVETIVLNTLGRSSTALRNIIEEARALGMRPDETIRVNVSSNDYWQRVGDFTPRPLSSLVLPEGLADDLVGDVKEFLSSREWYFKRGIPWRRGYLLHGPPGTGKTSLISALAGHLNLNLYSLNLTGRGMADDTIVTLLLNVPKNSILLLEDVDSAVKGREVQNSGGEKGSTLTFSGLLNALDGVASKPGLIVFMTTNHVERLDPALIRPGRIDRHIELPVAQAPEIARMLGQFYEVEAGKTATEFAELIVQHRVSMAEVQQHLLVNKRSPEAALEAAKARWGNLS